jgi:nucleotide-binding universal stress UspA family protein
LTWINRALEFRSLIGVATEFMEDRVSYTTIMVYVDAEHPSRNRIELAADLAERFNSVLIGVSALLLPAEIVTGGFAVTIATGAETETHLSLAGDLLRSICHRQKTRVDWRPSPDPPLGVVTREARAADLVVLQSNPQGVDYSSPDTGAAVMQLGRPALVVPKGVSTLRADQVVVAWQDSREARRAVSDALPFLHEASAVTVVEICDTQERGLAQARVDDVVGFLTRHRINARGKVVYPQTGSGADQLIKFAQDIGADLLVTGAYRHGPIGEWILGGMTRDLIKHSPICCLMSH